MKNLHRVVWSRGMFLTPQHFQSQDQYFEDHLQFRSMASSGVNWGLTDLAVDQEALTNGLFTIRHCRGVLPDGLSFNIPDADEPPAGREIAEFFPPTQADLDVFLTIPERRPRGRNVTIVGTDPAEAANAEAGKLRNHWTTAVKALKDAKKAAEAGDFDKAVAESKQSEMLSKAAIFQTNEQKENWKLMEIR